MKRMIKIVALLVMLATFLVGCSKYVCPAYSNDAVKQIPLQTEHS